MSICVCNSLWPLWHREQLTCQKSAAQIKVKYNFVDAIKSAHFLIIFGQNAHISVNFCAFLLIFELVVFFA